MRKVIGVVLVLSWTASVCVGPQGVDFGTPAQAQNWFQRRWNDVKGAANTVGNAVSNTAQWVGNQISGVWDWTKNRAAAVSKWVGARVSDIKNYATKLGSKAIDFLKDLVDKAWSKVKSGWKSSICGSLVDAANTFDPLFQAIKWVWAPAGVCLGEMRKGFICGIPDLIQGIARMTYNIAKKMWEHKGVCLGGGALVGGLVGGPAGALTGPVACGAIYYVVDQAQQIARGFRCLAQTGQLWSTIMAEGGKAICNAIGGLIFDIVVGILSAGSTVGASIARWMLKIKNIFEKISPKAWATKLAEGLSKNLALKVGGKIVKINVTGQTSGVLWDWVKGTATASCNGRSAPTLPSSLVSGGSSSSGSSRPSSSSSSGYSRPQGSGYSQPQSSGSGTSAVVSVGKVAFRRSGSSRGGFIKYLYRGAEVTLLGRKNGTYCEVRSGGTTGWAYCDYLKAGSNSGSSSSSGYSRPQSSSSRSSSGYSRPSSASSGGGSTAKVNVGKVAFRRSGSSRGGFIKYLYRGAEVTLLGRKNGSYCEVRSGSTTGWAYCSYLAASSGSSSSSGYSRPSSSGYSRPSSSGYSRPSSSGYSRPSSSGYSRPSSASSGGSTAKVNVGKVAFRRSGSSRGGFIKYLYRGAEVTLLGRKNGSYCEVRAGGTTGWAYCQYLTAGSSSPSSSSSPRSYGSSPSRSSSSSRSYGSSSSRYRYGRSRRY